ncbi:hypothetical protein [Saccharomonospora sp. CUA-673]|nr:hypothetical protein [Saccharomonospora sp. CUA-673]
MTRHDLESGAWRNRHADLLEQAELDVSFRLIVSCQHGDAEC